jgi:hypothetical protein
MMSPPLTSIGTQNATGEAQIAVQDEIPAGALVILLLCDTEPSGSSTGATVSDTAGNHYSGSNASIPGGGYVGISYAYNITALPAGSTITYRSPQGTNLVSLAGMYTTEISGSSDPLTSFGGGQGDAGAGPYVSSGGNLGPFNPGDLLVACVGSTANASSFVQSDGWLSPTGAVDLVGPTLAGGYTGGPDTIQMTYAPMLGTDVAWAGEFFSFALNRAVPAPIYSRQPKPGVVMTAVKQSGSVTPGHAVVWSTTGVVTDGGSTPAGEKVLGKITGANFNTTNDQPIVINQNITAFMITRIVITNASLSLTTAAGGFYPQASKGGTPIVANTQVYSSLTTSAGLLQATLASFGSTTRFSSANLGLLNGLLVIWLALTTAQGAAATADVFLIGVDLS